MVHVSPRTVKAVRSRQDGSIGLILETHQEDPSDPLLALVEWADKDRTWHKMDDLDIVDMPTSAAEVAFIGEFRVPTQGVDKCIGRNLRRLRADLGLTQFELGARVGISGEQVRNYESARRSITAHTLVQICAALRIDIKELLR